MLFFLFSSGLCHVLAIDLGSEYYKMAQSTISGEPKMVLNSNSQVSTPTAIAFRSSRNITKPIIPEDVFKYQVKFGAQAVPLLKRNSTLGFQYLNRVIGRYNHTEFHTCPLANITELLAISLYTYIGKTPYTDGLSFVIPQFWTNEQRRTISEACEIAGLTIQTIVDDFSAISILYGSTRNNKYKAKPKNVLFIDVGATSIKAYAAKMVWNSESSTISQTAAFWSEKCGGYYFAKSLAAGKKISINKAKKLLQTSSSQKDIIQYVGNELEELTRIIHAAMNLSAQNGAPIDEVQVTGGASTYKFAVDTILAATKLPLIHRDFNANEAYALGAVIAALQMTDMNVYPPVYISRVPMFSMVAVCGDAIPYCVKNEVCEDVLISNSTGCERINMYSTLDEIPEGTLPIMAEYDLKNISKLKITDPKNAHGIIKMKAPDALIDAVTWCQSPENCKEIEAVPYFRRTVEHEEAKRWANAYLDIVKSKERKMKLLVKVEKQLNILKKLLIPENKNDVSQENVFPIPENLKEVFMDRYHEFYSGKMHNMDEGEVSGALEDLEDIVKSIAEQL